MLAAHGGHRKLTGAYGSHVMGPVQLGDFVGENLGGRMIPGVATQVGPNEGGNRIVNPAGVLVHPVPTCAHIYVNVCTFSCLEVHAVPDVPHVKYGYCMCACVGEHTT